MLKNIIRNIIYPIIVFNLFNPFIIKGAFAEEPYCQGMIANPPPAKNIEQYDFQQPEEVLRVLQGEWMVVSTINWFMKGWRCFSGSFSYLPGEQTLQTSWRFKPWIFPWSRAVDIIRPYSSQDLSHYLLTPKELPQWVNWLQEQDRQLRIIEIASPDDGNPSEELSPKQPRYVVLFDCGISLVPEGELFVLVKKGVTLSQEELDKIKDYTLQLGIKSFRPLGMDCSE